MSDTEHIVSIDLDKMPRDLQGMVFETGCPDCAKLREQLAAQTERADAMYRASTLGEVWYWQGDGDDFPESLCCPVLMQPEALRTMLARLAAAEARAMHLRLLLQNLFGHCWLAADDDRGRDAIKEVSAALANTGGEAVGS